jgi:transcriptional regulator with XRE-family HTH domain
MVKSSRGTVLSRLALVSRRKRLNLTQQQVADIGDISLRNVQKAEAGKPVSQNTIAALCFALEAHPAHLVHDAVGEDKAPNQARRGSTPQMPTLFVGRKNDLQEIRNSIVEQLAASGIHSEQAIVVLRGLPGVGKTTIAKALAYDEGMRRTFRDGVLWASLGPSPRLRDILDGWSASIGIEPSASLTDDAVVSSLSGYLADREFLIIVDDVFDYRNAVKLLLGGPKCATVITTRFPPVQENLTSKTGSQLSLDILSEADSLDLLEQLAPDVVKNHRSACKRLVQEIECLPLAIQIVGRMVRRNLNRFGDMEGLLDRILANTEQILEQNVPADVLALTGESAPTVRALFKLSTDLLDAKSRKCFASLAAFAAKPHLFHLDDLDEIWEMDARPIVETLVDFGLVEFVASNRFQVHSLLIAHAASIADGA